MTRESLRVRQVAGDALAASPVVAVILMTAVTVVLASAVFVIVNNLTSEVGDTAIVLSVKDEKHDPALWKVWVQSSSEQLTLDHFQFILTVPNGTIVRIDPGATFQAYAADFTNDGAVSVTAATGATATQESVQATFIDVDGNGKYSPTDVLELRFDDADADGTFSDAWPDGDYRLQIRHKLSSSLLVTVERQV